MDRTGPPTSEGPPPDAEASSCTAVLELRGTQVARARARLLRAGDRRWLHFETLWMTLPAAQFRQVLRAVIPGRMSLDEYVAYPLDYREALPELGGLHVSGLLLALEEQREVGPHPEQPHTPSAAVRAGYSALLARLPPELGGRLRAPATQPGTPAQATGAPAPTPQTAPPTNQRAAPRPGRSAGPGVPGWAGPHWRRAHQELPELYRPVLLWTGARLCCAERRPGAPPWSVTLYPADRPQEERWHWQLDRAPEGSDNADAATLPEPRWSWTELPPPPEEQPPQE